ncbi:branched-chain amino acid ABC transporter permease [Hippea jasoniae]|uniref:branched-chain amino acid ABC transporter permease n=1 Tax=Hippea jasoniae TaxID=944479 RepID=UPI0005574D6B|nr:branched-chain amino acid ABC transporter permease [Hippea jasoniae]
MLLQQLINGLTIGGVYALIAMGLALVYGILRIIHVAHAGVYVVGAYSGLYGFYLTHSLIVAAVFSVVSAVVVGVLIEVFIYLPLIGFSPLISLIASIGVFISIEEGIRLIFGPYIKSFPADTLSGVLSFGSITISKVQLFVLLLSIASIAVIWFVTNKTKFGLILKAVSEDMELAESFSINSKKVLMYAFAFGSAFAGLAGLLVGLYFNSVYPSMGDVPAYKSLAIIVVGGMSNIWGAFVAALLIGIVEAFSVGVFNLPLPRDSIAFIFMVIVLMVKPQGIMDIFSKRVGR